MHTLPDNMVDPRRVIGQTFSLRRTWPDKDNDFVASIAALDAARIVLTALSFNQQRWALYITGPYFPPELRRDRPHFDSIDEAKADLRAEFDGWLNWALAQNRLVTWYGADSNKDTLIEG